MKMTRAVWLGLCGVVLAACGGGGSGPAATVDPGPPPVSPPPVVAPPNPALPGAFTLSAPARVEVMSAWSPSSTLPTLEPGWRQQWDFGDGSFSAQAQPTHAYKKPGTYRLSLTVSNQAGQSVSASASVQAGYFAAVPACSGPDGSGWCPVRPTARGDRLLSTNQVSFINRQRGWVSTQRGVWTTVDGGAHWALQSPAATGDYSGSLKFADEKLGYRLGRLSNGTGYLKKTIDGGLSWQQVSQFPGDTLAWLSLPQTGTLISGPYNPWMSTDDGATWRTATPAAPNYALAVTESGVLQGFTLPTPSDLQPWMSADFGTSISALPCCNLLIDGTLLVSDRTWLALARDQSTPLDGGFSLIRYLSTDAGKTWQAKSIARPELGPVYLKSARLFEGGSGWAVLERYLVDSASPLHRLLRTGDGGLTWSVANGPQGPDLYVNSVLDSQSVVVLAAERYWLSLDSAQSWSSFAVPVDAGSMAQKFERQQGVLLASTGHQELISPPRAMFRDVLDTVFASADEGRTWSRLPGGALADDFQPLSAVRFFNADQGIALRESRVPVTTQDGGVHWQPYWLPEGTSIPLRAKSVAALSAEPGGSVFYAWRDYLVRSTDRGLTWTSVPLPDQVSGIRELQFTDSQSGWAILDTCIVDAGSSCRLSLATTADAGVTWSTPSTPSADPLTSFAFSGPRTGLAWIPDGPVWSTQDGGASWTPASIPNATTQPYIKAVHFVNPSTGWMLRTSASTSSLLRTDDGGKTWTVNPMPDALLQGRWPAGLAFVDASRGWIVGQGGLVIATEDGGRSWTAQDSGTKTTLFSVTATDARRLWITGDQGVLLSTSTGGR